VRFFGRGRQKAQKILTRITRSPWRSLALARQITLFLPPPQPSLKRPREIQRISGTKVLEIAKQFLRGLRIFRKTENTASATFANAKTTRRQARGATRSFAESHLVGQGFAKAPRHQVLDADSFDRFYLLMRIWFLGIRNLC
jgi:hypothetical protein